MKKLFLSVLCILAAGFLFAQPITADKVVAQVGDKIILKSDVEIEYMQLVQQQQQSGGKIPDNVRCDILKELITQKLLLFQAAKDSVVVSDEEVNQQLDSRIRYYEGLFGSQEKMEEFYGKTVEEIKQEFFDDLQSQMVEQKMQDQIVGDVSVSPAEVRYFFNSIPKDSLPYINAQTEISEIILIPKATDEQKAIAKQKAEDLRQRLLNGEDFSKLAELYSDDAGSRKNGGDLGCQARSSYDPAFPAAAFKLQPGEISDVVETQFGYHIIQMVSRQGDKACLKHILITPGVTNLNIEADTKKLDSVRSDIIAGKISFCQAASKYSDDATTNKTCGDVLNTQTGSTFFEVNQLDPDIYYAIENLKPGEISTVLSFTTEDGKKAVRIILLKSETQPHVMNLKEDYARLESTCLEQKKTQLMDDWVVEKLKTTYLKVDSSYSDCDGVEAWQKIAATIVK